MQGFKNMKIRTKFTTTVVVIALAIIILVGMSFFAFLRMSGMMESFSRVQYSNTKAQMNMRKDIQTINKRILLAIMDPEGNTVVDQKADFDERFGDMQGDIDSIGKTLGDDVLINTLQQKFDAFRMHPLEGVW